MEWISQNMIEFLLIMGMLLLGIEILVLGFSTFVLFFVGLAALVTAGLVYIEVVPATMLSAVLSVGVLSALGALFLWKPLKAMQSSVEKKQVQNDFIGLRFTIEQDLVKGAGVTYRYSGIEWKLECDKELSAGTEVEVVKTDVGVFHVTDELSENS